MLFVSLPLKTVEEINKMKKHHSPPELIRHVRRAKMIPTQKRIAKSEVTIGWHDVKKRPKQELNKTGQRFIIPTARLLVVLLSILLANCWRSCLTAFPGRHPDRRYILRTSFVKELRLRIIINKLITNLNHFNVDRVNS